MAVRSFSPPFDPRVTYPPVAYEEFKAASETKLQPQRVSEGSIGASPTVCTLKAPVADHLRAAFMFESSMMFTLTDYAMKRTGKLHEHDPCMWDDLKGCVVSAAC